MRRRGFLKSVGGGALVMSLAAKTLLAAPGKKSNAPNILLIMADDLGYECLGCYGGTSYATPNIDALAKRGMKFENCHSCPVCSPSRTTIMTGRYTFRTTTKWGHIPDSEVTFGSVLASAGYKTALAGKWQMALLKDNPKHVAQMGFAESAVWAWHEGPRYWEPMIYRNDKILDGVSKRYGPDVYTDFLIDFMKTNKDNRFLAYYPMCLTHFPKGSEPKGPNGKRESYKEMVENMDRKIGDLVAALEKSGLRENTLILFTGDNGTPTSVNNRMGDRVIRGGKGKLSDAGTHVPLIANWPGITPAGTTCGDLIDFTDFMPTLAELAGAALPAVKIDGTSFAAQLHGEKGTPREWIYTEWAGKAWARTKQWKLYRDGRLYDMTNDPQEKARIAEAAASAEIRSKLQSVLNDLKEGKGR